MRDLPFRVVLVQTHFPGNLGSVARAMKNLGFSELFLVSPIADPKSEMALRMAVHADDILQSARIVGTLSEALADCVAAVGTASKVDGVVRSSRRGFVREIMPQMVDISQQGKVAIVFGSEPNGMTNEEVALCSHLIEIPTTFAYDSMNLASAVAICLYELRVSWLAVERNWVTTEKMAPLEAQERAFANLKASLLEIGFLYGEKADSLFEGVRHMLMRCRPQMRDIGILHGLARQISWFVRTHPVSMNENGIPGSGGINPEFSEMKDRQQDQST